MQRRDSVLQLYARPSLSSYAHKSNYCGQLPSTLVTTGVHCSAQLLHVHSGPCTRRFEGHETDVSYVQGYILCRSPAPLITCLSVGPNSYAHATGTTGAAAADNRDLQQSIWLGLTLPLLVPYFDVAHGTRRPETTSIELFD